MNTTDVLTELDEIIEYFNARADAEYHTDSASPAPNEAMRLGIAATMLRARVEALTVACKPFCAPIRDSVPNSYVPRFDINIGQYRALQAAIKGIGNV
jgi:hypothetical protein